MAADCPPITHFIDRACFEVLSKEEVKKISVKKITEPKAFAKLGVIDDNGLYSRALGPVKRGDLCETCNQTDHTCPGHYGHIELTVPVFHPMLVRTMYDILTKACLECHKFRLSPPELTLFLAQLEALSCGFDHLVDQLHETSKDICRGEKDSEYLTVLLRNKLDNMIREEKERVPDYEAQSKCNQRSGIEKLAKLFRTFITGKLIKPQRLCPHCSEKKTTTSLQESSTILIGVNVGKAIGRAAKGRRYEKLDDDLLEKKRSDLHILKTEKKKVLTPIGARDIFRKLWHNEKQTLKRIFRFLNVDVEAKAEEFKLDENLDLKAKLKIDTERFVPTDLFFIDCILVPPGKFRPPMSQEGNSYEGPRTGALGVVMKASIVVGDCIDRMLKEKDEVEADKMQGKLMNYWRELQLAVHCLYDNEMDKYGKKKYPGLKQLIDKKEGLFRKNMMGKRVNFAARSVISPDPNISVDQIGVPMVFAKVLTYPQPVAAWNIEQLRQAIKNGPSVYPGAVSVVTDDGITVSLTKESTRLNIANRLTHYPRNQGRFNRTNKVGPLVTIVNRHLLTGDVLLFNRQPTLHKPSIMAFRARVLPNEKGFRLHYANCKSFNADFDGDEMNAHLPQSELARSEAYNIASVNYQYLVPKDGSPLGGLIQDHVVAVCILTRRDVFYDREHYNQLCFCSLNFMEKPIKLEKPAIIKPVPLWTGKQVISTIIRNCIPPGKPPPTLEIKSKVGPKIMHVTPAYEKLSDCFVYIKDGELLTGLMDKSNVGATQYGLVHACYELYGGETSSNMMSAFARFATWYLQLYEGFTLGIADILVEDDAEEDRFEMIRKSLVVGNESAQEALNITDCTLDDDQLEDKLREAHSDRDPLPMKKLDAAMKKRTDDISSSISNRCLPEGLIRRFPDNNLQMMIQSGAKGGTVNALQISCLLGQIELEGRRVPLSMSGRSLPSFKPYDTSPKAGGFVSGRFLTGIQPQEFFFHCMAGREGLIDTAVKTSRSGYLQRCLIKHLEGLTVNYDQTVRDSCGSVIQFLYGEDGLDITKCQMLKNKAFSLLVDNHAIIDPSQDELDRLNKAKEAYEEDVIARTNDIQAWVDKNGEDRVRRLRGSGFLDFQAHVLKNTSEHVRVFGAESSQLVGPYAPVVDLRHAPDTSDSEDEKRVAAQKAAKKAKQIEQQEDVKPSFTQKLVSITPNWKKEKILQAWYALSFKEKRKWNRDWDLCPDPTTAVMNPGAHYGVVPEKLDELIEEFVSKNPKLIINPATLIGCDTTSATFDLNQFNSLLDCDTNPELSRALFAYYNHLPGGARMKPKLTKHEFYNLCYNLYMKMLAQPGEAVGLLAAQSIGEPSTQMTLNTFHFAGRGEMNVTLGIPRLREILMTASAKIGTPSMDLPLLPVMYDEQGQELNEEETEAQAMHVRLNLNAVRLSDVLEYVDITERMVAQAEPAAIEGGAKKTAKGRKKMKIETNKASQARMIEYTFLFHFLPSKYYRHDFVTSSKQIMTFMETVFTTQLKETISKREKRLQLAETLFDQSGRKMRNDDDDGQANSAGNQQVDGEEQEGGDDSRAGGNGDAANVTDDETEDEDDEAGAVVAAAGGGGGVQMDLAEGGGEETVMKQPSTKSSKHKFTMTLLVKPMTTRLDMGALIKAEAKRTYIHRVGNIQRALIVKDMNAKKRGAKCDKMVKTEGVSLLSLVRYSHILDLNAIYSNDIHAIARTYGIEAASQAIRREMANVFAVYGIEVDSRHLSLIADYMTYNGAIRGMNRNAMEACASPLQQMSFESTIRYLKQAAILGLRDDIKSPSAALVFGRPTKSGTGLFAATTSQTVSKEKLNAPPRPARQPQQPRSGQKPGWRHSAGYTAAFGQQSTPASNEPKQEVKVDEPAQPPPPSSSQEQLAYMPPDEECW